MCLDKIENVFLLFQENNLTELNNMFAKIDERRRVSGFNFQYFYTGKCVDK